MRKSRFFIWGFITLICIAVAIMIIPRVMQKSDAAQSQFTLIDEVYDTIVEHTVYPMKQSELIEGAMRGMVDMIPDPYSTYYTAKEAEAHRESLAGERVGIGAEITKVGGKFIIVAPIKGSPAEKAGIKPYDELIQVNDQAVSKLSFEQLIEEIRGEEGTVVTLTVFRSDTNEHQQFRIERQKMDVQTVLGKTMEKKGRKIGYIAITTFGEETAAEWLKETKNQLNAKAEALIVDVRGNPGGYLVSVSEMISSVMKEDTLFAYMEDGKGELTPLYTEGEEEVVPEALKSIPIVLLQDEGSASASEVLSSALQTNKRSYTIGTTSFGKGTVQSSFDLSNGDELKLSTHKWLTPEKEWIHQKGVKPDLHIEQSPIFSVQPQMVIDRYQKGEVHEDIQYVQEMLVLLQYDLARTDGYYDHSTDQAVQAFHKKQRLKQKPSMNRVFYRALQEEVDRYRASEKYDEQLQMAIDYIVKTY